MLPCDNHSFKYFTFIIIFNLCKKPYMVFNIIMQTLQKRKPEGIEKLSTLFNITQLARSSTST